MAAYDPTEKAGLTSDDPSPHDTAIAILAADYAMLSCNQATEKLTGYRLRALHRLHPAQIFEPAATLHGVLQSVLAGESPASVWLQLLTADGRRLPVEVHCEPLQSLDCSNARIILRVRAAAARQARHHREAKLLFLGHLASDLSHEIRNPMNAIFLHADIVEDEVRQPVPGDGTQVGQSLATIKAELTRLNGLMQDYLFLVRLADLQPSPTDLRALVEDLVHELHPQCALRGVVFELSGLDRLGEVDLHQSSFRRALFNVLQLLIEAVSRDATLTVSGGSTHGDVQLQIHDPNAAIPPEVWAALDMSLRAKMPEPADLRTYVAQEIITAHGGEIAVSVDARVGRLCTITLPLAIAG